MFVFPAQHFAAPFILPHTRVEFVPDLHSFLCVWFLLLCHLTNELHNFIQFNTFNNLLAHWKNTNTMDEPTL